VGSILATSTGNALEWYDLIVYGYFAGPLSRQFFPSHHRTVSLLLALGTFALSYLARPIGALAPGPISRALPERQGIGHACCQSQTCHSIRD
jgi:MFS transporter, MHS family, proline/betaine transporter